jgi:hypothetical protein
MRPTPLFLQLISFIAVASSQLLVQNQAAPRAILQSPLMSPITSNTQQVPLADLLGRSQQIQIFAGLIRDVDTVSAVLEDTAQNSTVLAPENAAIQRLPRKPWKDAGDYKAFGEDAYEGTAGKDRANNNLKRFVESHVVPKSPWDEGEKVQSIAGQEVWWEKKDGKTLVRYGRAC